MIPGTSRYHRRQAVHVDGQQLHLLLAVDFMQPVAQERRDVPDAIELIEAGNTIWRIDKLDAGQGLSACVSAYKMLHQGGLGNQEGKSRTCCASSPNVPVNS